MDGIRDCPERAGTDRPQSQMHKGSVTPQLQQSAVGRVTLRSTLVAVTQCVLTPANSFFTLAYCFVDSRLNIQRIIIGNSRYSHIPTSSKLSEWGILSPAYHPPKEKVLASTNKQTGKNKLFLNHLNRWCRERDWQSGQAAGGGKTWPTIKAAENKGYPDTVAFQRPYLILTTIACIFSFMVFSNKVFHALNFLPLVLYW